MSALNFPEVSIKTSARAKRVKIVISLLDRQVSLIIPKYYSKKEAMIFLQDKQSWILNTLARLPSLEERRQDIIPIYGVDYKIEYVDMKSKENFIIDQHKLIVSKKVHPDDFEIKVKTFLKNILFGDIKKIAEDIASKLDVKIGKISLKDTKKQWGSCASNNNLSFSWRLIFAPKEILYYLVVHEVCHIIERNHSEAFWQLVHSLCPEYKRSRVWLKKNGMRLHKYI